MNNKIPFIWTNDDIEFGRAKHLKTMLDFLKQFNVPGSFAIVPIKITDRPNYIYEDKELCDVCAEAIEDGHELFQHSVTHICVENGLADIRMYAPHLMGYESAKEHSRRRLYYERFWQEDTIADQIKWGKETWEKTFGKSSFGYRPGCGCFSIGMFQALEKLGFKWTSATDLVSFTGWMWISEKEKDYPFEMTPPVRGYKKYNEIIEIPALDDISFKVKAGDEEKFINLGWRQWEECLKNNWPYVMVSHWHGLEHNNNTGYKIHRILLDKILNTGQAEPITLSQYYEGLISGKYPFADSSELPDANEVPYWHRWYWENKSTKPLK